MKDIFFALDDWIAQENLSEHALISSCQFKILGQAALFEAKCNLTLIQTADLDAYTNASYKVIQKLNELLEPLGKHYDIHSKEIWMPKETEYTDYFKGNYVEVLLAKPEYILISKAKKAPEKNKPLIIEYLSKEPSETFFKLTETYQINLEEFING